jgi:cytochrome c biogenesis protein CcmG/thiol:disulfide interchange protein DsbE
MNPNLSGAAPVPRPRRRLLPWMAGLGAIALLAVLAVGLTRDPHELPSTRIGKPWPAVALPVLGDAAAAPVGPAQWRGRARIVNLWASWCGTCREEHPALMSLAATLRAQGRADQLVGLNYKDRASDAGDWLAQLGNPFAMSLVDADGRMAIELGVYGAPETFVIDAQGVILHRHVGALTPEIIARELLPRLGSGS